MSLRNGERRPGEVLFSISHEGDGRKKSFIKGGGGWMARAGGMMLVFAINHSLP